MDILKKNQYEYTRPDLVETHAIINSISSKKGEKDDMMTQL